MHACAHALHLRAPKLRVITCSSADVIDGRCEPSRVLDSLKQGSTDLVGPNLVVDRAERKLSHAGQQGLDSLAQAKNSVGERHSELT